jgi:hypothetical protein
LGKFGERLGDVSHVRKGILELSQFGIEPTSAATVAREVRFEQRCRIHFGAALFAFDRAQVALID